MQERTYGDLKLSNIGKLMREKAEFYHRNNLGPSGKNNDLSDNLSDGWLH